MSSQARASIDDSPSTLDASRKAATSVALVGDEAQATLSPAAVLQHRLVTEFDAPPAIAGRWSSRRTAALVIGFNGVFWAAVLLLMRA